MMDTSLTVRGVAHDLNNQLMVLLNSLDRMIVLCPETADIQNAMQAAERCTELVAQLLPRTRASRELLVSVHKAVSESAAMVRALLPDCNQLLVECHTDDKIKAESGALQQVLVNLCLNAVDAMNGPGTIRISARDDRDGVVISVSDTGPGVPPELRERIFEPLFTTNAARGGNGLGLARVREIVTKLGGTVSVHDVFPRGACFQVQLPSA